MKTCMRLSLATMLALTLALPAFGADLNSASWSQTDASNNATAPNGFPEGMAPSQVNDAARATMGAVKRWHDQVSNTQTTTGTGNAQVLTYPVAPAALALGDAFSFIPGATNTGAATLNVNSLGAKEIRVGTGKLNGSELITGLPAAVYYDGTYFQLMAGPAAVSPSLFGAVADATTAADTPFATAVTAAPAAGPILIKGGGFKLNATVVGGAHTTWQMEPGSYFPGPGYPDVIGDATLVNNANKTLFGRFGSLSRVGSVGAGSANQAFINLSATVPATGSLAGYQKNTLFVQSYTSDPSAYPGLPTNGQFACTICRELVGVEARAQSLVNGGRVFGLHALVTSAAGTYGVLSGVNVEVQNLSGNPSGVANQPQSTYGISVDNVGNTLATAALWVAPGNALFQDIFAVDASSFQGNAFALYDSPGTSQTTRFAIKKNGSGSLISFDGGGGATDPWITVPLGGDTAMYLNSASDLHFQIGGVDALHLNASGATFAGGATCTAGQFNPATATFAGGVLTHC